MMAEATADAGTTDTQTGDAGRTFTQDDLNKQIGDRVARERAKYADYDTLKTAAQELQELKAAQQSETEKLTGKATKLEQESQSAKAENMRLRVAMEKQLPADLIDRLRGSSKEELEADADKLLELVKPTPSLDGGARENATNSRDLDSMIRQAADRTRI